MSDIGNPEQSCVKYVILGHIFVNQVFQFCETIGAFRQIIFDSITLK